MIAHTLDGCSFDPTQSVWRVRTSTENLYFHFNIPGASQAFCTKLQKALGRRLLVDRPEAVLDTLKRCRVLVRHASLRRRRPVDTLHLADVVSYVKSLAPMQLTLAAILLKCLQQLLACNFDCFAPALRRELPTMQVEVLPSSSPANLACRRRGALTKTELKYIVQELATGYETKKIKLINFSMALLMLSLAPRPGQIALLNVSDLTVSKDSDGKSQFAITMPIIKVRRIGQPPRRATPRRLHPHLGAMLKRQSAEAMRWGIDNGIPAAECPLFPRDDGKWRSITWPQLPWTVGHATGSAISVRAINTFKKLDLSSIRPEPKEQHITATRLRRSLATIARGEGRSYIQIGELLGHQGPTSAHIYTEPTVDLIRRVENAIDFKSIASLYMQELSAATRARGRVRK